MPKRKRPRDSAGPLQRNTPPSGDGPKEAARCGLTEGLKGAPAEADAPAVFQTESLHAALSAGLCRGIPVHFGFLACSFGCRHLVSGDNRRCEGNGETQSGNHQNELLHRVLLLVHYLLVARRNVQAANLTAVTKWHPTWWDERSPAVRTSRASRAWRR